MLNILLLSLPSGGPRTGGRHRELPLMTIPGGLRLEAAYGRDDHFAFCLYTIGNVDGRHSGTIKLLEAAG
jgi:hypothetical protein